MVTWLIFEARGGGGKDEPCTAEHPMTQNLNTAEDG